jgi:hypothetical protein
MSYKTGRLYIEGNFDDALKELGMPAIEKTLYDDVDYERIAEFEKRFEVEFTTGSILGFCVFKRCNPRSLVLRSQADAFYSLYKEAVDTFGTGGFTHFVHEETEFTHDAHKIYVTVKAFAAIKTHQS